jgi:2-oxoisovalerate dehydrogenase E1 component alpha subunit
MQYGNRIVALRGSAAVFALPAASLWYDKRTEATFKSLFEKGGLVGLYPSKISFFWPVSATNVADTGHNWSARGAAPLTLPLLAQPRIQSMSEEHAAPPAADPRDHLDHESLGISAEQVLDALRGMIRARTVDDRLWLLSRQGKAHFVITSAGHEATQFGCAWAIRAGRDYVVPYYRDMALALALGQTARDIFLHALGRADDPASGGRQMFGHFSEKRLRIVSGSSSVGSHPVHAVGLALAFRITGESDLAAITFFGEGATAEGAWHEAIGFAGIHKLPVVFVCENNQYAISVHQRREVPVADVAAKAAGYGMPGVIVDGNDIFAVYAAAKAAMDQARSGGGPTLLECKTYRLRPHSNADDERKYRTAEEVEQWRARDPIARLERYVVERGLASAEQIVSVRAAIADEVEQAILQAEQACGPAPDSLHSHVYAEEDARRQGGMERPA